MIDPSSIQTVTLSGERFVIMPEAEFLRIAGGPREPELPPADAHGNYPAVETARILMARKMIRARQSLGWSQAELARRAGVRPETVNRIEQAKRSPSLATFDKLYRAIEAEQGARAAPKTPAVHKRKAKK
ncbi:MAG TPA: helix-turn-helix domain-containing protein [Pirellulales bacterium]|nr:helix-turn-helix domain-containing protein [Pirellulales bacterium]